MISQENRTAIETDLQFEDYLDIFIKSGINIAPDALEIIYRIHPSREQIQAFIEKVSFHLKGSLVSKHMVLKAFKTDWEKIKKNQQKSNKKNTRKRVDGASENKLQRRKEKESARKTQKKPHEQKAKAKKIEKSQYKREKRGTSAASFRHSGSRESGNKKGKNNNQNNNKHTQQSSNHSKNKSIKQSNQKISEEELYKIRKQKEKEILKKEKEKDWETLEVRSGTSTFKALASEYSPEIEVLKDPTGHLFVEGGIQDFHNVQVDKYETLRDILKRRPEGNKVLGIEVVNRLNHSTEVSVIGMVVEKRQTGNQNTIFELEDDSGQTIMALVTEDKQDLYQGMTKVLEDHVLLVSGYLNINEERNSRIILANEVLFPDTPNSHQIHPIDDGLAICLISDTHFGSIDWLEKVWDRFVDYLNCRIGNDKQLEQAGRVKYVVVAGDIVDGIGIYPNQDKRLSITDIYKQYEFAAEQFARLPDYVQVILSPGDHDSVHKAVPTPAIPEDIAQPLYDIGTKMLGAPAMVKLHGIKTEVFHGTSLIEMKKDIPGMDYDRAQDIMAEFIRARHLAPSYGNETELAPTEKDWLTLKETPDILHTGHLHKVGVGSYHGILTVNSGCFQGQTDYMKSFGIVPDFGKPTLVNIKSNRLEPKVIDLTTNI